MAYPAWPEPPSVDGIPLDTALLLNRDYYSQLYALISPSPYFLFYQIVPSTVVRAFSEITETLIDTLCTHGHIQRNSITSVPKVCRGRDGKKETLDKNNNNNKWPSRMQAPAIHGRPLDTALLLHRDYANEIFARMAKDEDDKGLPVEVFAGLLDNNTRLINALCSHGGILRNPLREMPRVRVPGESMGGDGRVKPEIAGGIRMTTSPRSTSTVALQPMTPEHGSG
ncbi:MAG: hypothetical protein Q9186_003014 [Xanthomendoza sp. 1 TL-2023]